MKISRFCLQSGVLILAANCAVAQPTLFNAATPNYGVRVSVDAGTGVVKDKNTGPDAYTDSNPHTRYVMTGAPYTINVELPFKVMVEKLSLTQSDYAKETAPKEIEVTFDDGQKVTKTLELLRPEKVNRKTEIKWQDIPVGREIKSLKITVLSNHDGEVKWGGLGDLAIWTSTNLDEKFQITGYDPNAPAFVRPTLTVASNAPVKVNMPPVAKAGEHPRILFTPQEIKDFAAELPKSERGKATLEGFLKMADTYTGLSVSFPSIEDTVAEKAGKQHNGLSNRVAVLGFAYGLTGKQEYAKAARNILVGYGQRYESYPRHAGRNKSDSSKVTFQRLSEAMWLIPQIEGYDYIYNSGVLSEDDKKLIETGLIRAAIAEIRRQDPAQEVAARTKKDADWRTKTPEPAQKADYPNWLNFYNAATIMAGVTMGDQNMIDLATTDLKTAIMSGIGADGMWGEGAIGYQLFAMSVIAPAMETAARNGIDLWGFAGGRFKQLFDSPLRYAYPDGTLPGINDSGRGKLGSWQTMVYDYGYLRYGDPRYAFLLNETPRQLHTSEGIYAPTRVYETVKEPATVAAGSTLFGSLGYGILRDTGKYALMDYGPHGGVHGHYDKLNLLLFSNPIGGAGDEMGGEPKFYKYEDQLHGQWTTQTVAHNTMSVDGGSQMANDGKLLIYEAASDIQVMRAQSDRSYPGVLLDRTVVVTPDAVLDLFAGRSAIEHTWNRTLRFTGKLNGLPAMPADAKPLGKEDGFQHIKVAATQSASNGWKGVWNNKAGAFNVLLAGVPNQQVVLGVGPDDGELALAQQSGKSSDFAAVYGLDGWKNDAQTVKWLSKIGDAVQAVELTQKDGTLTRVFVAHGAGAWNLGDWKSDARVLVVRQKGADIQLMLCGGTFAQNGGLELRQNVAGNYRAQQRGTKLEIVSQWTP